PDSSACGASCAIDTTVTTSSFTPGSALAAGSTYTWQVHALGTTLGGVWSTRFSFTIAGQRPLAPALSAPSNGATSVSSTPSFSWSAVTGNGATGSYRIQAASIANDLSSDPDSSGCGASCAIDTTVTTTSF